MSQGIEDILTDLAGERNKCCGFFPASLNRMVTDISSLSLDQLQGLYVDINTSLMESLLRGADWEEVREERIKLTCIAREIHHRKYPLRQSPSETQVRFNY